MTAAPPTHTPESRVRDLLRRIYGEAAGSRDAFIRAGMSPTELVRLYELVCDHGCRNALEIGMANGTSSVILCDALGEQDGRLTSIDPFQTAPPPQGFGGAGVENVRSRGFDRMHRLIEQLDYLALPQLVAQGEKFDFVFIDGYHSFDYTLIDIFYADLLLADGGVLAVHDTTSPPVYRAVRYLEAHKPYERLSAPLMVQVPSPAGRALRRLHTLAAGPAAMEGARSRRRDWQMLSAHRKLESRQVPEYVEHPF